MPLRDLNPDDQDTVFRCINAVVNGPFIDDWEFSALMGLERTEAQALLSYWPELDDASDEDIRALINSSLNNVLGYPTFKPGPAWDKWIGVPENKVSRAYRRWKDPSA